jgi:hypothetical protein
MNDPGQKLTGWTVEDHLAFDIGFALPRAPVRGLRRALAEGERHAIAAAIVEHLRLCGWQFHLPRRAVGHGTGKGGPPA